MGADLSANFEKGAGLLQQTGSLFKIRTQICTHISVRILKRDTKHIVKMHLQMVKMHLCMIKMHLQMVKMHLQIVKLRLKIPKMQLKIAKMLLKIVKKHSYNYFVVNLPLSDERSQLSKCT